MAQTSRKAVHVRVASLASTHTIQEIADAIGYTYRGVQGVLLRLGMKASPDKRRQFSPRVDRWVSLHVADGLSTQQIARLDSVRKNTVIQALRNRGVLRQSPGRAIEREVWFWTVGRYSSCLHNKRGDRAFDLLLDGDQIDVKSASEGANGRYAFAIHHQRGGRAQSVVDWYWLVFTDRPGRPIYRCLTSDIRVKYTFAIRFAALGLDPRFSLVGHLDETKDPRF